MNAQKKMERMEMMEAKVKDTSEKILKMENKSDTLQKELSRNPSPQTVQETQQSKGETVSDKKPFKFSQKMID